MSDTPKRKPRAYHDASLSEADRIEQLERELAEAKRDAKRYRWLRNRHYKGGMLGVWRETKEGVAIVDGWLSGADLDKAIDAAMKEGK